jgi:hypothetical protein
MAECVADRILKALEAEIVSRGGGLDYVKAYSSDKYRRDIFGAASAYWKDGNRGSFNTRMNVTIKFGLRDAFDLGAADVGISPEDYTQQDTFLRDEVIQQEQWHVNELADFMFKLANDPNAKLSDANSRLELWAARFDDMRTRAKVILGKDAKAEWVVGPTEESCPSCQKLNGVVKRYSFWQSHGVLPQAPPNPMLQCGGWNCLCELVTTDKPVRKGRMPSLP